MQAHVYLNVDPHVHTEALRERLVLQQTRLGVDQPLHLGGWIEGIWLVFAVEVFSCRHRHRFAE